MTFPVSLPRSRIAPPMEAPALRWGVLGSGWIAAQFIASVRAHTRQSIAAVGSRTQVKADASAHKWEIATAHGSYEALVTDPTLDVIYVATPHNMHHEHVLLALGAGKHVLVEKPMALNRAQAAEMVALARRRASSSPRPCGRTSCQSSTSCSKSSMPGSLARSSPSIPSTANILLVTTGFSTPGSPAVRCWISAYIRCRC